MALDLINIGTAPNDGNGDPLRTGFEKTNAAITDYDTYKTASFENFVIAGRGAIGINATTPVSDIDATPQVLTGFDTDIINDTRGVTQILANDGLILEVEGVWEMSIKVTLSFAEENAGREIKLQLYNDTDDVAGTEFVYFVGRNQGGVNMSLTMPFEVPASVVGDLLQIRVLSDADTFTSVENIGTIFSFIHSSEAQFI